MSASIRPPGPDADRSSADLVPAPWGAGVAFVSGAGGFLGGAVAGALARAGWRVAGFGHPARIGPAAAVEGMALWRPGDIARATLQEAARELGRPELVFHAAGGASVGESLADPAADEARTLGSLRETLAFLADAAPRARLVYPSSAAVYGADKSGPIAESAALDPISPYGRHKVMAEAEIRAAAEAWGLQAAVVRFFSLYGPGLHKQLLWELSGRLEARPAEVELSGDGEEVRDFLFVDDAVRLVGLAATAPVAAAPLVLNGGSGRAVTVRELAEKLRAAVGAASRIRFNGQVRPGDPRSLLADVTRAADLGFSPQAPLAQGLERLVSWTRKVRRRDAA